jgi:hypothetical protein
MAVVLLMLKVVFPLGKCATSKNGLNLFVDFSLAQKTRSDSLNYAFI